VSIEFFIFFSITVILGKITR